jgi:hypothetical protein
MTQSSEICLVCQQSSQLVPLLTLNYHGEHYFICPQHLPILIHHPERLADVLPGVENISPVDHNH